MTAQSNGHPFTEMVVDESDAHESYLVICNGPNAHAPAAITLVVQNHRGERRRAVFDEPLRPFSANKLRIRELVPDAVAFADGQPLAISGNHHAHGMFIRPYVMTTGPFLSGYHGGDLSSEGATSPAHEHRFLDRGRVNPMYAVHQPDMTTTVDLFNTHTVLDDDFWVDLYLYDKTGALVSDRPRWLLARRDAPSRGQIADVLPPDRPTFTGHLVLAFSQDDKPAYPRTLQALVAYRTPHNTTRVMLWSDEWNSPQRAARRPVAPFRAFYRAWFRPPFETLICISNSANERAYCETAPFTVYLINETGERRMFTGDVPPHGTVALLATEMFPDARTLVGDNGLGTVVIESAFDLAEIQMTRHARSGVVAAEHFMALPTLLDGEDHWPSGA